MRWSIRPQLLLVIGILGCVRGGQSAGTAPLQDTDVAQTTVAVAQGPLPSIGALSDLAGADELSALTLEGIRADLHRDLVMGFDPRTMEGQSSAELSLRWQDGWKGRLESAPLPGGGFQPEGWPLGEAVVSDRSVTWDVKDPRFCCGALGDAAAQAACEKKPGDAGGELVVERLSSGPQVRVSYCGQVEFMALGGDLDFHWETWKHQRALEALAMSPAAGGKRSFDGTWTVDDKPLEWCSLVALDCSDGASLVAACRIEGGEYLVLGNPASRHSGAAHEKCGIYDGLKLAD